MTLSESFDFPVFSFLNRKKKKKNRNKNISLSHWIFQRLKQGSFFKEFYKTVKCKFHYFTWASFYEHLMQRSYTDRQYFCYQDAHVCLTGSTFYIKMHTCRSTKIHTYSFQCPNLSVFYATPKFSSYSHYFIFLDKIITIHL